jgi:small subunit ribosomal protein S27Ae
MAAKAANRSAVYALKDGKAVLQRKFCPRCGAGVLLGDHKNRLSCGKCGYTEFKK